MKYTLTVTSLLLVLIGNAQNGFNLGFKAGVTSTKLIWEFKPSSTSPDEKVESRRYRGYYFQFTSDIARNERWDWNASLGVLQKNGDFDFFSAPQGSLLVSSNVYKWTYLSFTNLFRGKLRLGKASYFTGSVGPRIDYLLKNSNDSFSQGGIFFYRDNDDIKKINLGLNAGVGVMFRVNKLQFGFEASRNVNFNRIMNVKGPRADGLGDEGFYFRIIDRTVIFNTMLLLTF
ncbi:MAG: PorT family protein [Cyclobacteriaceae bacterium]|nr:PorT family protein [Cyclobacteriaceae bacterium]